MLIYEGSVTSRTTGEHEEFTLTEAETKLVTRKLLQANAPTTVLGHVLRSLLKQRANNHRTNNSVVVNAQNVAMNNSSITIVEDKGIN